MKEEPKKMTEEEMKEHERKFLRLFNPVMLQGLAYGLECSQELEKSLLKREKLSSKESKND